MIVTLKAQDYKASVTKKWSVRIYQFSMHLLVWNCHSYHSIPKALAKIDPVKETPMERMMQGSEGPSKLPGNFPTEIVLP